MPIHRLPARPPAVASRLHLLERHRVAGVCPASHAPHATRSRQDKSSRQAIAARPCDGPSRWRADHLGVQRTRRCSRCVRRTPWCRIDLDGVVVRGFTCQSKQSGRAFELHLGPVDQKHQDRQCMNEGELQLRFACDVNRPTHALKHTSTMARRTDRLLSRALPLHYTIPSNQEPIPL